MRTNALMEASVNAQVFSIRYTLGLDPSTGKRKRIEVAHQGTYESAKVELRRLLRSIDNHEHVEPTKIKVSDFLTQWIETSRSQVSLKRMSDMLILLIISLSLL